ncbi:MAG TPA: tetratricopeptide repeat protein [Rugosibacter sp.]
MMHKLMVFTLFALALPAHAADSGWSGWSSLWRNADQRGEALLQQGDAVEAAKVFADPRRKAYAKIMSGDYAQAAHDLSVFDDSDAHYNRGNALAHVGDLQSALDEYDFVLKLNPNNKDARHNRDLVANALKQKVPPPQNSSGKQSQDGKSSDKKNNGTGSSAQNQDNKNGQGKQGQQNKSSSFAANSKQNGKGQPSPRPQRNNGQEKADQASQPLASGSTSSNPTTLDQRNSAEQAHRDVTEKLNKPTLGQKNGAQKNTGASSDDSLNGAVDSATIPRAAPNEKQLAQEQWLRSIPDDPGGLLRRKFLVEHLMRQQ